MWIGSIPNGWLDLVEFWEEGKKAWLIDRLGVGYDEEPERHRERSPSYRADRVQAPIFLLYGEHDPTLSHARTFRDHLEERGWREGEEFEFVELSGEGHYSDNAEHRRRRFRILEEFFRRRLSEG